MRTASWGVRATHSWLVPSDGVSKHTQPAINLTVQALVATLTPDPAKAKAPEPAPGASGAAPPGGADKAGLASTAAPIKRWGKPAASAAAQPSAAVRIQCLLATHTAPGSLTLLHLAGGRPSGG